MAHIVLLGDSIFDNAAYVGGAPDVVRQLRARLSGSKATLLAVDGAITRSVAGQLQRLPADATHLVVSVGGNDALGASYLLSEPVLSVGQGVALLARAQERFSDDYREMFDAVLERGIPAALCTIYDTPTTAPQHLVIKTALSIFNDVITRAAFARGLALVDLRLICNEDGDYANPIEPSAQGGDKIAAALARLIGLSAEPFSQVIAHPTERGA